MIIYLYQCGMQKQLPFSWGVAVERGSVKVLEELLFVQQGMETRDSCWILKSQVGTIPLSWWLKLRTELCSSWRHMMTRWQVMANLHICFHIPKRPNFLWQSYFTPLTEIILVSKWMISWSRSCTKLVLVTTEYGSREIFKCYYFRKWLPYLSKLSTKLDKGATLKCWELHMSWLLGHVQCDGALDLGKQDRCHRIGPASGYPM